jgi:hypothetical protein
VPLEKERKERETGREGGRKEKTELTGFHWSSENISAF